MPLSISFYLMYWGRISHLNPELINSASLASHFAPDTLFHAGTAGRPLWPWHSQKCFHAGQQMLYPPNHLPSPIDMFILVQCHTPLTGFLRSGIKSQQSFGFFFFKTVLTTLDPFQFHRKSSIHFSYLKETMLGFW